MAIDRFVGMSLVHPNGSARPWVPWCVYSVLTFVECVFNLSVAAPSIMGTVHSRSHYQVLVEMEDKPEIIKLINNVL